MSLSPSTSAESEASGLEDRNHAVAKSSAAEAGLDDQSPSTSAIVPNDETAIDAIGENGATAQSQRKYYISDLPDELLVMVLGFVPIDKVFTHMKCSKRWRRVCRAAARKRKSLVIGYDDWFCNAGRMRGWNWRRDRPSEQLDQIVVARKSLVFLLMKNVTRLCIFRRNPKKVCPVILKFAGQLTMLQVGLRHE